MKIVSFQPIKHQSDFRIRIWIKCFVFNSKRRTCFQKLHQPLKYEEYEKPQTSFNSFTVSKYLSFNSICQYVQTGWAAAHMRHLRGNHVTHRGRLKESRKDFHYWSHVSSDQTDSCCPWFSFFLLESNQIQSYFYISFTICWCSFRIYVLEVCAQWFSQTTKIKKEVLAPSFRDAFVLLKTVHWILLAWMHSVKIFAN